MLRTSCRPCTFDTHQTTDHTRVADSDCYSTAATTETPSRQMNDTKKHLTSRRQSPAAGTLAWGAPPCPPPPFVYQELWYSQGSPSASRLSSRLSSVYILILRVYTGDGFETGEPLLGVPFSPSAADTPFDASMLGSGSEPKSPTRPIAAWPLCLRPTRSDSSPPPPRYFAGSNV